MRLHLCGQVENRYTRVSWQEEIPRALTDVLNPQASGSLDLLAITDTNQAEIGGGN